jgi:hypothetical protein
VSFLYAKYRLAVAIDVSPSMFVMDPVSGVIPFDAVLPSLVATFRALCGSADNVAANVRFSPDIYVSVMARACYATVGGGWSSSRGRPPWSPRFLVHGYLLRGSTLTALIDVLQAGLHTMEVEMAQHAALAATQAPPFGDLSGSDRATASSRVATLPRLIESALLALKLMPGDACPLVFVVTDGATQRAACLQLRACAPVSLQSCCGCEVVHAHVCGLCRCDKPAGLLGVRQPADAASAARHCVSYLAGTAATSVLGTAVR